MGNQTRCADCAYFNDGQCHFHAPRPITQNQQLGVRQHPTWPTVKPDHYCAHWQPLQTLYTLNDRGEWAGDETYSALDFVTEPGKSDTLSCLKENKSTSPAVLRNVQYWIPITFPDLESA